MVPFDGAQDKIKAPLTFALIESAVLETKCIKCHSNSTKNSGNLNLETYANVHAALASIRDEIISGTMPKAPGIALTDLEKFLILKWIQNGAPEVRPVEPTPTPEPTPMPMPDPSSLGLEPIL